MESHFEVSQLAEDDTIIVARLLNSDWESYHQAMDRVFEIASQNDARFDLILEVQPDPPPGLPLTHLRMTSKKWVNCPNLRSIMIVRLGQQSVPFFESIARVAASVFLPKIMRDNYWMLSTFEEALDKITSLRAEQVYEV